MLSSDPDVDPEQLCRARTLLRYGLVLGDDGSGSGLADGMDMLRGTLVDAEPVLVPRAEPVLAARRPLAIFGGTALGLWEESLTHRLAVLEALAAAPEPDPAAAEQARSDLAQALEDADLPSDHIVRVAAVAVLADPA